MIRANPVTATYRTVFARDHKERMVTFRKAANYPFYVFATCAPGDYMAPWREEAFIVLGLLALFTLATDALFSHGMCPDCAEEVTAKLLRPRPPER